MAERDDLITAASLTLRAAGHGLWPAHAPCPAHTEGACTGDYADRGQATCRVFVCPCCRRPLPICFGSGCCDVCDDCHLYGCDAEGER